MGSMMPRSKRSQRLGFPKLVAVFGGNDVGKAIDAARKLAKAPAPRGAVRFGYFDFAAGGEPTRLPLARELSFAADGMGETRVEVAPQIVMTELSYLYHRRRIAIPPSIGYLGRTNDFYLTQVTCNIRAHGLRIATLHFALNLDAAGRRRERITAYSIFPGTEWKTYGTMKLMFTLDASLSFELPAITGHGVPGGAGVSGKASASSLLGPIMYSFRRCQLIGTGANSTLVEWDILHGEILRGGDFRTWIVLQVPKSRSSTRVDAMIEARLVADWKHYVWKVLGWRDLPTLKARGTYCLVFPRQPSQQT